VSPDRGSGREGDPPPAPDPLTVPVVDTHCHLDLIDAPVAESVAAAAAVGVTRLISIGVDVASSRWQAEVAEQFPTVWAAVAIHPNEAGAGAATPAALDDIARLAALPQVRAVGETGLDHFRTTQEGHRAQEESLRAHIGIACETGKALVVHDRDAHDDLFRVLRSEPSPVATVIHCFSGDAGFARRCAEAGWFLSFAGTLTFRNAPALREAAAAVPRESLLVETDAPFLTPTPFRGRPNSSYLVPHTVRALAHARGEDLDEICAAVFANAERAFGPL
jgi:TatD DNase family protein